MKCELCHDAEASAVLHMKRKDGSEEELFVCKACSDKAKSGAKPSGAAAGPDGPPPKVLETFLNATLEFVEEIAKCEKERSKAKCPECGRTLEEVEKTGLLKCPGCWTAFADAVRERFLASQYGRVHVSGADETVVRLERGIKEAVLRQDFEKAAELKRELNTIRGRGRKEGDGR